MNPHVKETRAVYYLEETTYPNGWQDFGMCVEVGGLGMVICTVCFGMGFRSTIGFRIVDENDDPLLPYRTKNNTRYPVHFVSYLHSHSGENITPATFHMIANCKYAKLQIMVKDVAASYTSSLITNAARSSNGVVYDNIYNHKTICTMSVIPLVPNYQPGANTIFTYPKSRMPRMSEDDKPPVIHKDKITSSSP